MSQRQWRLTRRGFLISAGLLGGGLALGVRLGWPEVQLKIAEFAEAASPTSFGGASANPTAWFELTPQGRLRLYLPKVEMGQGVMTALTQLAAEELGIAPAQIEVVQASTAQGIRDLFGTAGSTTVVSLFKPLREAAAAMREMLLAAASAQLKVEPAALALSAEGVFVQKHPARRIAFSDLLAQTSKWEVPERVPLKSPEQWRFIGASVPRLDLRDKVTGAAVYGYDVRLPGMLYGAVLRPPTLEARLRRVDTSAAERLPNVRKVVVDLGAGFVGVVATSRAAAQQAIAAIRAEWDEGRRWEQEDIDRIVTVGDEGGVVIQRVGDALSELQRGVSLQAEYRTPFAIQTPLEAQAAAADVRPDRATVWVSTQSAALVQQQVARAVGLREDQVEVFPTFLGGGFGRKSGWSEVAVEAARLSKAVGAPVHVGWSRAEELQHGFIRPPTHHRLSARLQDGRVVAIQHEQASGNVLLSFVPGIARGVVGADFGATRGATIRYAIPHRRTIAWRKDLPVRTGPWRGLGLVANTFAVESFMDELAHLAGADPLAFRLAHLPNDAWGRRMAAVLRAAAERAGWGKPAPQGRARGIACSTDVDTVVAQVAEVSLEGDSLRVHRITLAMDCGLVVNPDGVRTQAEGGVMWGGGSALLEEASVRNGQLVATNFDRYPLLSIDRAPDVEVILLDTLRDGQPRGVGEPPMGPTAAAIANALFALTGRRVRQLPITPTRVRAALSA
ncbi:MAG: molybdopterin-dependent oxidoreductase [Thermoflexales bacterium]|nr:molybdopterin-dependent oxidoreductase [Thermoflexales bacterium]